MLSVSNFVRVYKMPALIDRAAASAKKGMASANPIASMAKGGPIKKTGMYKLHAGEYVVKAAIAKKMGMGKK